MKSMKSMKSIGNIENTKQLSTKVLHCTSSKIRKFISQYHSKRDLHKVSVTKLHNPSNWTIKGISVAGICTTLHIPEINITIDAGAMIEDVKPHALLITHYHGDHSRFIKQYRKLQTNIIDYKKFSKNSNLHIDVPLINSVQIEKYDMSHTVKSIGYGISVKTNSKNENENENVNSKEVMICGDTKIEGLYKNKNIFNYPTIVVECTNYDSNPRAVCAYNKFGHISWKELEPIVAKYKDNNFLLIHTSQKLTHKKLSEYQNRMHDMGYKNVKIFT